MSNENENIQLATPKYSVGQLVKLKEEYEGEWIGKVNSIRRIEEESVTYGLEIAGWEDQPFEEDEIEFATEEYFQRRVAIGVIEADDTTQVANDAAGEAEYAEALKEALDDETPFIDLGKGLFQREEFNVGVWRKIGTLGTWSQNFSYWYWNRDHQRMVREDGTVIENPMLYNAQGLKNHYQSKAELLEERVEALEKQVAELEAENESLKISVAELEAVALNGAILKQAPAPVPVADAPKFKVGDKVRIIDRAFDKMGMDLFYSNPQTPYDTVVLVNERGECQLEYGADNSLSHTFWEADRLEPYTDAPRFSCPDCGNSGMLRFGGICPCGAMA